MEFKENIKDGICDAAVEGELTIYHVNDFKNDLEKVIKKSTTLKLDLSQVSEIDTSCIQLLMQARNSCRDNEKTFELISISPAVEEVIEIFGLQSYLIEKAS
ncbi:MAG: STAS domain-containing protein [Gammaproteobacteria bacterium]|nr:STAS domain-containing protein [Gammaproteobacteria bacterium]